MAQHEVNNFTKGVLDPLLIERTDLKQYAQGLITGRNIVVMPQGGCYRIPGKKSLGRLRRRLTRFNVTSAMITAPNGGTTANLVDKNTATNFVTSSGPNANPWVVWQADLGAAVDVNSIDLNLFKCANSSADDVVQMQSADSSSGPWTNFGAAYNIRTTTRSRRASLPPGQKRTARYWRMAIVGQPSIGVITVGDIVVSVETTRLSAVKGARFAFSVDQTYAMVITDRNIDVYRNGVWVAAVGIPHRSEQLSNVTFTQDSDTMMLFHVDVACRTVLRSGAHDEWDSYEQAFVNIPDFTSSTAYGVTSDEVQQVIVDGIPAGVTTFTLEIEGVETAPITLSTNTATLATNIDAALEALPNVDTGLTVTVASATTTRIDFTVRFSGGTNVSRGWAPLFVDLPGSDYSWTVIVDTLQDGRAATGDIIGPGAGYPRCGAFFQGRLYLGGMRQRPSTILGTMVNSFDFAKTPAGADMGVEFRLSASENPTIHAIFAGRHLQIFSNMGEWYITNRVISATDTINAVLSTQYGTKIGVPIVSVDGASVFAQASGRVLREFIYSQAEDDYTAEAASLLASHLITDVVGIAYRRASETTEGNQIFVINSSGIASILTTLRSQDVAAFTEVDAAGFVRDVVVDAARQVHFIVERTIGGVADNWLEIDDTDLLFVAAATFSHGSPQTSISGLSHLEGATVGVLADGDFQGFYTVSSGAITLPVAVTSGHVGINPVVEIDINPVPKTDYQGKPIDAPTRVSRVIATVSKTGAFAIAANQTAAVDADIARHGTDPFTPMMNRLFTGKVVFDGLEVPADEQPRVGRVKLSQPTPAPLQLLSLYLEVA